MHSFYLGNPNGKTIWKTKAYKGGKHWNPSFRNRRTDMDWSDLAQDRDMWLDIANMLKLCVWYNVGSLSVRKGTISFSGRTLPHGVKQSVSWLHIIRYLVSFLVFTEEAFFLCAHKHTTLTMLSSIMQNFSPSLCTTVLELWLPGAAQFQEVYQSGWQEPHTAQDFWYVYLKENILSTHMWSNMPYYAQ